MAIIYIWIVCGIVEMDGSVFMGEILVTVAEGKVSVRREMGP